MTAAPLYGLLLAGGASSRMRRDKAALQYAGEAQLERAARLLARHVERVFVSVRAEQRDDPLRSAWPLIVDLAPDGGPLLGIRSAFAAHPAAAWLVLACDLPFLSDAVLEHLLAHRDPAALATVYRSSYDGLAEPLCAIWEPAVLPRLAAYQDAGGRCPRKFLMREGVPLLEPLDARALDNVNTPEEYARASAALRGEPSQKMQMRVQYFAILREQAGRTEELVETAATDAAALYAELAARHRFTLPRDQLKVAINGEFSTFEQPLRAGDAVVFIPPVAGG